MLFCLFSLLLLPLCLAAGLVPPSSIYVRIVTSSGCPIESFQDYFNGFLFAPSVPSELVPSVIVQCFHFLKSRVLFVSTLSFLSSFWTSTLPHLPG
ncbi:hypothetical protein M758_7G109000 [Ceratodon purpureus]|nr:hypothetical protein M758_7G109000 [Ceratodon purpureus]